MSEQGEDLIGYDKIVEQSMRDVVCNIIKKIAKEGLPEKHSVFIIFKTSHKDVVLSDRVKFKHPRSVKVTLQNKVKITKVTSKYFNILLSFDGIEEKVKIPFDAVLEFTDPYIRFSLNFDTRTNLTNKYLEELIEEYREYSEYYEDEYLENYKDDDKNKADKVICLESAKKKLQKKNNENKKK